ncbi:MAG: hypothetical protein WB444_11660 [Gallionella sp.]
MLAVPGFATKIAEQAATAQWAMKMNQIKPLTTRSTVTVMISFCSMSISYFSQSGYRE